MKQMIRWGKGLVLGALLMSMVPIVSWVAYDNAVMIVQTLIVGGAIGLSTTWLDRVGQWRSLKFLKFQWMWGFGLTGMGIMVSVLVSGKSNGPFIDYVKILTVFSLTGWIGGWVMTHLMGNINPPEKI